MSVPRAGVWSSAVTFFDPENGIPDLESQKRYCHYLSVSGIVGLVTLDTNAETFLLTREERTAQITTARDAVEPIFPIMAGVSGFSTAQVLEYIEDAYTAGANYALVLPACYYPKSTTAAVIEDFYLEVAEKSQLPIVIYNCPEVCNGIDLDADTIIALTKKAAGKIVGVKLTCGCVGKTTRLAAALPSETFSIFGGQSDSLVGGLVIGGAGCISAFASVFPRTACEIHRLFNAGKIDDAMQLQRATAITEAPCKAGIASTKCAVSMYSAEAAGIVSPGPKLKPRAPYQSVSNERKASIGKTMSNVARIEKRLAKAELIK